MEMPVSGWFGCFRRWRTAIYHRSVTRPHQNARQGTFIAAILIYQDILPILFFATSTLPCTLVTSPSTIFNISFCTSNWLLIATPSSFCLATIFLSSSTPITWSCIICFCNCSTPWLSNSLVRAISLPSTLPILGCVPTRACVCCTVASVPSSLLFAAMAFNRFSSPSFSFLALCTRSFRRRSSPSPSFSLPTPTSFFKPCSSAPIMVPALTRHRFAWAELSCCSCALVAWSRRVKCSLASCNCALRSRWQSSHIVGSDIGAPPPPGPVSAPWRPAAVLEFAEAVVLGRLRKLLQALVLRHLRSLASLMVRR